MEFSPMAIPPFYVVVTFLASAGAVLAFLWRIAKALQKTNRILDKFLMEHEILIMDYCKRMEIDVKDLPTRLKDLSRTG